MSININKAINILQNGGVCVVPTDTIYGLVCVAGSKIAVNKLYKIKKRDTSKPCIILVTSLAQIKSFGVNPSDMQIEFMNKYWHFNEVKYQNPESVSIILSCDSKKYEYLHRGVGSIAFRMIGNKNKNLKKMIDCVGGILAPSANPQGMPVAITIAQAKKYFGTSVDFYLDGGTCNGEASTLVDYTNNKLEVLRIGKVKIKQP